MNYSKVNDEVLYACGGIVAIDDAVIDELKRLAGNNVRKRVRLCAHSDCKDSLHEMTIVLGQDSYIRPHRHSGKCESFHVIQGAADVLIFDDDGNPVRCLKLGEVGTNRLFYFRINMPWYHSVVIQSEYFIFHETTQGPFDRGDTEFAVWAPPEENVADGLLFLKTTLQGIGDKCDS